MNFRLICDELEIPLALSSVVFLVLYFAWKSTVIPNGGTYILVIFPTRLLDATRETFYSDQVAADIEDVSENLEDYNFEFAEPWLDMDDASVSDTLEADSIDHPGMTDLSSVSDESESDPFSPENSSHSLHLSMSHSERAQEVDTDEIPETEIIATPSSNSNIQDPEMPGPSNSSGDQILERPNSDLAPESASTSTVFPHSNHLPSSSENSVKRQRQKGENEHNQLSSPEEIVENHGSTQPIKIKLKFLDDELRIVDGELTENVLSFKRKYFNVELSEHRIVRLIYKGKLLSQDCKSLGSYGLFDNCVVHCHVSQPKDPPPPPPPPASTSAYGVRQRAAHGGGNTNGGSSTRGADYFEPAGDPMWHSVMDGLDLSNVVMALLWITVVILWVIKFKYSYMFSSFSTFMLIFLTFLLVVPRYIFSSSEERMTVTYNSRTLRNFGIDRIFVVTSGTQDEGTSEQGNSPGNSQSGAENVPSGSDRSRTVITSIDVSPVGDGSDQ